jgi:hypothetical protein
MQVIMEQLKELSTGQEALKSDVCAVIEDKVGNCMGSITKELKLDITDLCSKVSALELKINDSQAQTEETFDRQHKKVTPHS